MVGDEDAFNGVVRLYAGAVRRIAWQILHNLEDAEDTAQEAWLVAFRRLPTLRDPDRFGGWLHRIAANAALRKRQQRLAQSTSLMDLAAALARSGTISRKTPGTRGSTGEDDAAFIRHADLLPAALEALSSCDHQVVALHYFSAMDLRKIAQLLGVPIGTVKSRLFHARQTIRKEIEKMAEQKHGTPYIPSDIRKVIGDQEGEKPWQPLFSPDLKGWSLFHEPGGLFQSVSPDTLPQHWKTIQDGLIGEHWEDGTCLKAGDASWLDYEVSLLITPIAGGNAQVFFRVDEQGRGFYVLDMMMGWQTVDIHRVDIDGQGHPHLTRLSVVNYPLEPQREYSVSIAPRGYSLTTYVNGVLVNQVTDDTYRNGGIGLNVWQAKTLFRDIQVRHLHTPEPAL